MAADKKKVLQKQLSFHESLLYLWKIRAVVSIFSGIFLGFRLLCSFLMMYSFLAVYTETLPFSNECVFRSLHFESRFRLSPFS